MISWFTLTTVIQLGSGRYNLLLSIATNKIMSSFLQTHFPKSFVYLILLLLINFCTTLSPALFCHAHTSYYSLRGLWHIGIFFLAFNLFSTIVSFFLHESFPFQFISFTLPGLLMLRLRLVFNCRHW